MCATITNLVSRVYGYLLKPPTTYAMYLREATRILATAKFGVWDGTADEEGVDKYDFRYWEPVADDDFNRVLRLKTGQSAAEAVDAILTNIEKWRVDCDHTVQISNLYAMRKTLGDTAFNARVGPAMKLRPRDSSGLKTVEHYARDEFAADAVNQPWRGAVKFDAKFAHNNPGQSGFTFAGAGLPIQTDALILKAPPGSRVRWTNLGAQTSDVFRHENTVKLQNDVYAAGGLSAFPAANEYPRSALESRLAPAGTLLMIDEVEVFELHG